jgi:hypothetical protein
MDIFDLEEESRTQGGAQSRLYEQVGLLARQHGLGGGKLGPFMKLCGRFMPLNLPSGANTHRYFFMLAYWQGMPATGTMAWTCWAMWPGAVRHRRINRLCGKVFCVFRWNRACLIRLA